MNCRKNLWIALGTILFLGSDRSVGYGDSMQKNVYQKLVRDLEEARTWWKFSHRTFLMKNSEKGEPPPLFEFLAQLQIQPKMSKRKIEEEGYPLLSAPTTLTPPKSVRGTSQTTVQRAPPTTATGSESINNFGKSSTDDYAFNYSQLDDSMSVRRTSQTTVQGAPPTTAFGSQPINNTELANMQLCRELIKLEYIDPVSKRRILKIEFEKFHDFMCKSTAFSHNRPVYHVSRCLSDGQDFKEMMLKSMEYTIQKNFGQ